MNGRGGIISRFGAALLAIALFAAVGAAEDRSVDETRALDRDGRVEIEVISGSVRLVGWEKAEVRVEGTIEEDVEELVIEGDREKLVIEVKLPDDLRSNEGDVFLTLHVPEAGVVEVTTVSADVETAGLRGGLTAETVSGSIDLEGEAAEIEAESVSGAVRVKGGAGRVRIGNVSGGIDLEGFDGSADLESVSGDVRVSEGDLERLRVECLSGEVEFAGRLDEEGTYRFDLHSGDLTLRIEGGASFDVTTFSGDIDNAFGEDGRRTSRYTPGRELEFTTGGGGAEVRIETFSGDVSIREL